MKKTKTKFLDEVKVIVLVFRIPGSVTHNLELFTIGREH